MHHIMFDVDGTLVKSYDFDEECFIHAVHQVLGHKIDNDWSKYPHITDTGILDHHLANHDLIKQRERIHRDVKKVFTDNIRNYLAITPAQQVEGASDFIAHLQGLRNVSLSIATGGWSETAMLKLASAGIDVSDIPLASSNDHFSRTQIMKIALKRAELPTHYNLTYFGDAEWDKKACETLECNFVLVGNRLDHHQSIPDYLSMDNAFRYLGL
ncbi:HAD family hydrolase [Endozoicomonas arenosclerae]|uniref:HAD family hydrolase n=1 Tax=Endozoicomonas arenosclerae TaxID=1633495 RepID=UPI000781FFF7|nr:HAD family hydrolase [Endozoicomonas arenosclerae]